MSAIARAVAASRRADEIGLRMTDNPEPSREVIARQSRVHSELCEFIRNPTAEELGDILLATIRLGLLYGIQPEGALDVAVLKFTRRMARLPWKPTLEDWHRAKAEADSGAEYPP